MPFLCSLPCFVLVEEGVPLLIRYQNYQRTRGPGNKRTEGHFISQVAEKQSEHPKLLPFVTKYACGFPAMYVLGCPPPPTNTNHTHTHIITIIICFVRFSASTTTYKLNDYAHIPPQRYPKLPKKKATRFTKTPFQGLL